MALPWRICSAMLIIASTALATIVRKSKAKQGFIIDEIDAEGRVFPKKKLHGLALDDISNTVPVNQEIVGYCARDPPGRDCSFVNSGQVLYCTNPQVYSYISYESCPQGTCNPDGARCCSVDACATIITTSTSTTTTTTTTITPVRNYVCDARFNFVNGVRYRQRSLTSYCPCCHCNPVYGTQNDVWQAVNWCQEFCDNEQSCTGFFFQRHGNGHEICGFYNGLQPLSQEGKVQHGHQQGSQICQKSDYRVTANQTHYVNRWVSQTGSYITRQASILSAIYHEGIVSLYLHFDKTVFTDFNVTERFIDRILGQVQSGVDKWLQPLQQYNGFPHTSATVMLFGMTFGTGVSYDELGKYSTYPRKTSWDWFPSSDSGFSSECSWSNNRNGGGGKKPLNHSYSNCPEVHPAGLDHYHFGYKIHNGPSTGWLEYLFMTIGTNDPAALAADGYVSGEGGENDVHDAPSVVTHEIGHLFGFDDLYDRNKYPSPDGIFGLDGPASIMFSGTRDITGMDWAQMRILWDKQRPIYCETAPCCVRTFSR